MVQRRTSIPQELEDPEDCTIGEGLGDLFEPQQQSLQISGTTTKTGTTTFGPPTPSATVIGDNNTSSSSTSTSTSTSTALSDNLRRLPREVRNLLAGGIAGMIAKSVVAPMDRIKILYQVSSAEFQLRSLPGVVQNIIETEGLSALWKGNFATMIRVFPYSGIQFMVFDRCKRYFLHDQHQPAAAAALAQTPAPAANRGISAQIALQQQHQQQLHKIQQQQQHERNKYGLTAWESLVAGMIAGIVSVLSTYPLDLTRAQLAVLKRHKVGTGDQMATKSFYAVLMENYNHGGVGLKGLFRGISPTLLGILPYSGIAFSLNEQGKRKIQNLTRRDLNTMERMQCGAFAGLFAQTATYPIEVTRRRMQTVGLVGNDTAFGCLKTSKKSGAAAAVLPDHPESMQSTIRHLYAEQGIRGFFKGVSMNWMKGPVAFSISFTAFDTVQGLLESEAERAQRLPKRFFTKQISAATSSNKL
eukprot:CAMPEP_0198142786 /NCGR_PEP_ID=MMETSP1443-20131203/5480_1 /TAXON_ID=186043 /ORGANISM="Entomoneis sp., Strain CCMP2396" /LENGTH=471 /DNA_ID=CAMNT_0043805877 /DNA_START=230 /DNA_END=1645 /DNA_ORIENTATION=+